MTEFNQILSVICFTKLCCQNIFIMIYDPKFRGFNMLQNYLSSYQYHNVSKLWTYLPQNGTLLMNNGLNFKVIK